MFEDKMESIRYAFTEYLEKNAMKQMIRYFLSYQAHPDIVSLQV